MESEKQVVSLDYLTLATLKQISEENKHPMMTSLGFFAVASNSSRPEEGRNFSEVEVVAETGHRRREQRGMRSRRCRRMCSTWSQYSNILRAAFLVWKGKSNNMWHFFDKLRPPMCHFYKNTSFAIAFSVENVIFLSKNSSKRAKNVTWHFR